MKRCSYIAVLMGLALLLGSCWPTEPSYPRPEPWLCSINADGTGFRKIKKSPFNTPGLVDIYMTKDNRIIFYGEKLWISETDTIRPVSITDNIYTLQQQPARLSQSPDGSKLYFASKDKNIHELDLNTMLSRQLTSESVRTLRNPIVSDLGNFITYTSRGYGPPSRFTEFLSWMDLRSGDIGYIPTIDSICVNAFYSESEDFVYYEGVNVKRSRLDGGELSLVSTGGSMYPYSTFGVSSDNRYIIHVWDEYPTLDLKCHDKQTGNSVRFPIKASLDHGYIAKICKDANIVFYAEPGYPDKLKAYNLDTRIDFSLLKENGSIALFTVYSIAPTWDGTKLYFYADVSDR